MPVGVPRLSRTPQRGSASSSQPSKATRGTPSQASPRRTIDTKESPPNLPEVTGTQAVTPQQHNSQQHKAAKSPPDSKTGARRPSAKLHAGRASGGDRPAEKVAPNKRWQDVARKSVGKEQWRTPSGTPKTMDESMIAVLLRKFIAPMCNNDGTISTTSFMETLSNHGLKADDPRLARMVHELKACDSNIFTDQMVEIAVHGGHAVLDALSGELVVPKFAEFREECRLLYEETAALQGGNVSLWIPELGRVDPSRFAVSVTTVDGQSFSFGDHNQRFSLMDVSAPVTYCMAAAEHGLDEVHKFVGHEPSGMGSAAMNLQAVPEQARRSKATAIPHNPLITAGALVCTSMLRNGKDLADRMDAYLDTWSALCGAKVGFDPAVMVSARRASDRNTALAFMCKGAKAFPDEDIDLAETLELYYATASVTASTDMLANAAASLANGGVNPLTEHAVFEPEIARAALSLMLSCGMYESSGKWAFDIGLPAKSSVSGALMLVVPNVMGIAIYSPALGDDLLPAKGDSFSRRLADMFAFHHLDSIGGSSSKKTPTASAHMTEPEHIFALISAAAVGDLAALQTLIAARGSVNCAGYDGRSPLHLAASEGHLDVVEYLLAQNANPKALDRQKNTAYDDAVRSGTQYPEHAATYDEIAQVLSEYAQT